MCSDNWEVRMREVLDNRGCKEVRKDSYFEVYIEALTFYSFHLSIIYIFIRQLIINIFL